MTRTVGVFVGQSDSDTLWQVLEAARDEFAGLDIAPGAVLRVSVIRHRAGEADAQLLEEADAQLLEAAAALEEPPVPTAAGPSTHPSR